MNLAGNTCNDDDDISMSRAKEEATMMLVGTAEQLLAQAMLV
jgi:hypothetical protein